MNTEFTEATILAAFERVDLIASEFGLGFISGRSNYVLQEYAHAEEDATSWLTDTSQPCPQNVTVWADAADMSYLEAATYIKQKAVEFRHIVSNIRMLRLSTKVIIKSATTQKDINDAISNMSIQLTKLAQFRPLT